MEVFDLEIQVQLFWISIFLYPYSYTDFIFIAFISPLILLKHEVRLAPGKVDFMSKHFCFLNNSIVDVFEGLLCCSGHLLICWLHLIDICLRICFAWIAKFETQIFETWILKQASFHSRFLEIG